MHDMLIPEESAVVLLYGSANRDERRWTDAGRLDLLREPLRNLGFGEGVHFCLGAPLARLEARIVLEEFVRRVADYQIVEAPVRSRTDTDRGIVRLPAVIAVG